MLISSISYNCSNKPTIYEWERENKIELNEMKFENIYFRIAFCGHHMFALKILEANLMQELLK